MYSVNIKNDNDMCSKNYIENSIFKKLFYLFLNYKHFLTYIYFFIYSHYIELQ